MWCDLTTHAELAAAFSQGEYQAVVDCADAVLDLGTLTIEETGSLLLMKCQSALYINQPEMAISPGEQALQWAVEHGDWDLDGMVRINLGCALGLVGRVPEATALLEGFFRHRDRYSSATLQNEGYARFNLGVAYRHSSRLEDAIIQYRHALRIHEERQDTAMAVTVRDNLAWALMLLKDAPAAAEQLEAMRRYVNETLDLSKLQVLMVDLAAYHLLRDEVQEAKDICRDLVQALDERDRASHLATTYTLLGRIALRERQWAEARRFALEARVHAGVAQRWDLNLEATRLLSQIDVEEEGAE